MWGLGAPNKRIRVTNAMLANSRRWRGGAAPVGVGEYKIKCGIFPLPEKNECVQSTQ